MEKQAKEQIVDSQPSSKNILCDQCGEMFQDSDHEVSLPCDECSTPASPRRKW